MKPAVNPATLDAMRSHNREVIIALLETEGPLSRAELAKRANLSRTTVTNVVRELVAAELVTEVGDTVSTGGRPGILLRLNSEGWHAVGAELHSREWVVVVVRLDGTVVQTYEWPTGSGSPEEALAALKTGMATLWEQDSSSGRRPGRLLPAIGIGVPGTVDVTRGVVRHRADDPRWKDVSIKEAIQRRFGVTPFVINRHKASGLAEAKYGAGAGDSELIYVGVGTGISAAVFSSGKVIDGAHFSAGEIGHMVVLPGGTLCTCGNRGCLQTLASGPAMVEYVTGTPLVSQLHHEGSDESRQDRQHDRPQRSRPDSSHDRPMTGEAICLAAQRGDPVAIEAVRRAATYLGIALFNVTKVTNPRAIVIGGSIGLMGDPFLSLVREQVHAHARSNLETVSIRGAALGRQAGAIGAATLVLEQKLKLVEFREPPYAVHDADSPR